MIAVVVGLAVAVAMGCDVGHVGHVSAALGPWPFSHALEFVVTGKGHDVAYLGCDFISTYL